MVNFWKQTWVLTEKTLVITFARHWLSTATRAFIAPVIFFFIIAWAKNLFVPPSEFGIGDPRPIRTLQNAVENVGGGRDRVVFVNSGFTGGAISDVIDQVRQPFDQEGFDVRIEENQGVLRDLCSSTIRGVSACFGAVVFNSSPDEGDGGIWNYTMRADGALGGNIYVDQEDNDQEIYILPLQHAIDDAITQLPGSDGDPLPSDIQQYPYTSRTQEERERNITRLYMGTLIDILGLAYFIGIVGVCYQLTGTMATERELGMSQLIESMMPNRARWQGQAARLLSTHLAFDILYLPSWIVGGVIVGVLNYDFSNVGISVGYFIVAGLALSSWSIAFASLFRKAQLSGITVVIVSIVLAIIVQVQTPETTGAIVILSLIFPPMQFTLFIIYAAYWQEESLAMDLSQGPPGAPWSMPGYLFFVFAIIQFLVYPFIGAVIERVLYGTASKARNLRYKSDDDYSETVKISHLVKTYRPSFWYRAIWSKLSKSPRPSVHAVDNIDVSVLRGQIVVLLGANGSGKSTTLDMMAGLQAPSSGTIDIDGTGGIGLCPQKNVLWDELSVYEHVSIFNRLKASSYDSKEQNIALIDGCDLGHKVNAHTSSLSGGQKRKAQLCMMLTGGSKLCMLDEVSSGLDPLSRRKIWDIILAERGKRSMMLTTHFLDEADLLSDDITILSKGKLVAHGSAVELKHKLGGGYRVRIYHENYKPLSEEMEAYDKQIYRDQTVFRLPDSAAAARFIAELESRSVTDYVVNGPQIEDVFLRLADEVKEELERGKVEQRPAKTPSTSSGDDDAIPPATQDKDLKLMSGTSTTFLGQTWVLFRKRVTILRRNSLPYLAALLIPIIAAGLVTFFLEGFSGLQCSNQDAESNQDIQSLGSELGDSRIPAGPEDSLPQQLLGNIVPGLSETISTVSSVQALRDYVRNNYRSVTPGGFWAGAEPLLAWQGNYEPYFPVAAQNLMDVSLTGLPIATSFQAFDTPFGGGAGDTLQMILYFGLATSAFPGLFALYVNIERLRNVRALHYSNGVRAGPLWLAYTIFDFLIVLLVSAISIIIFTSVSSAFYAPGYLFVVLFLFGLSATLLSYVVSLYTGSQLATFAIAAGGQCSMFLLYFISFMCIVTYSEASQIDSNIYAATYSICLIFPAANLLRALLLTFNLFGVLCRNEEVASYPGDFSVYGQPILYLILQSAIFLVWLIWYDSGYKPVFLNRRKHKAAEAEETEEVDREVHAEVTRTEKSNDELRVLHATKAFGSNVAVDNITFGVPKGETFALLGPNGAGKSTSIALIRGDSRPSENNSDVLIEQVSIVSDRARARGNLGVCPQFDAMDQMTTTEHLTFYARARGVKDVKHNVTQILHAVGLMDFKDRMAAKLSGGNKRKLSLGIALMGNPSVLILDEPSSGMDAASKRVMWQTLTSISSGRSLVLTTHSMEEADALADRAGIMARRMLALGTADTLRKKHGNHHDVHVVHKDAPHSSAEDMEHIKTSVKQLFPGAEVEDRVFHGQMRFSVPNEAQPNSPSEKESLKLKDSETTDSGSLKKSQSGNETGISALFAKLEENKEKLGLEYYSVSQATLDQVFLSIITKHNVEEENSARKEEQKKGGVLDKLASFMRMLIINA
ncbi:hypothetical protein MBLNU230_g5782t1 [Neophaeotheca triangularis]